MRTLALLALVVLGSACDGTIRLEVNSSSDLLGNRTRVTVTDLDGTERFGGTPPPGIFEVAIEPDAVVDIIQPTSSSPTAQSSSFLSITGVQPGDFVTRLGDPGPDDAEFRGDMYLTFPALPGSDPLTTQFMFFTMCGEVRGGSGAPVRLEFHSLCLPLPGGSFDVFGWATSADATGYFAMRGITHAVGGTIAAPAWGPMPRFAVTVRGLTDETALVVHRYTARGTGIRTATIAPTNGDVTVELDAIPSSGPFATIGVVTARTGAVGVQRRFIPVAIDAVALDVDLAASPFPWIVEGPYASGDGSAWRLDGTGSPDAAIMTAITPECTGGPPLNCSGGGTTYGPGDATSLRATPGILRIVDNPLVSGYAEVRHYTNVLVRAELGVVTVDAKAPASVED